MPPFPLLWIRAPSPQPPASAPAPAAPLNQQIAKSMARLIHSGKFKPGQRLPSVRETAARQGVSFATVTQAFRQQEERGLVRQTQGRLF
jgi:DNA-binding transcriptional regulator YhcF (GntR family)